MTLFFAAIVFMALLSLRPVKNSINSEFISIDTTACVKGFFVLLVFLSHINNYFIKSADYAQSTLNTAYIDIQSALGQAIVVMFLFYSGYGVAQSISKKGEDYVKSIPKRRVLKTLLNFDFAVLLFVLLDFVLGILSDYSVLEIILSFVGWETVGNSNWYIFAVLILYIITYVSFSIFKNNTVKALWCVTGLAVVYIALMAVFKEPWWFDTALLYPLGMWFSYKKENILAFIKKKKANYYICLGITAVILIVSLVFRKNIICYEFLMISFCAAVVLLTMKFTVKSKFFAFFGKRLFEFYIFMRIPMILLLHFGVNNIFVFTIISFAVSLLLSIVFHKAFKFADNKIIK